jgi:hypothetical protein
MMILSRRFVWAALAVLVLAWAPAGSAQVSTTLSDKDRSEILALLATYRTALLECHAEQYADLFATPGGYFSSGPRGEVRTREDLIDMTLGYDRCMPNPPANSAEPTGSGGGRGPALPPPVIEWAPEGARGHIINTRGGGYYDDVYVKTPKGWRFKSRNVISDEELAAKLTTPDFVEIRQLAGDDHGHYENLYGQYKSVVGPRSLISGPFRTAGLRLAPAPGGDVAGLAYLRDNGGHYEDLYVKTPQGWRIKERKYFPPAELAPPARPKK